VREWKYLDFLLMKNRVPIGDQNLE
jgi:hypothetical protein